MSHEHDFSRSHQNAKTPTVNPFQPRSFGIQAQTETSAPSPENVDLDAQEERTKPKGFNLLNLPAHAPGTPPPEPPSIFQAKLTIGQPGDRYEQEADRVAQTVVHRINSPSFNAVQRQEISEQEEIEEQPTNNIQRQEIAQQGQVNSFGNNLANIPAYAPGTEPPLPINIIQRQWHSSAVSQPQQSLEETIQRQRGSGQGLADNVRQPMEQAFGSDFSGVRIHTDGQSDQLNQSLNARAFTTGQDVFFRAGAYNPSSTSGQELLAHELTHVVQQNGSVLQPQSFNFNQKKLDKSPTQESLQPKKLPLQKYTPSSDRDLRLSPANTVVQMNPLGDIWNGVTNLAGKGVEAAKNAMQAVMSLATAPARLPGVLAGITWKNIPDNLKAPIINKILEIEINLIKALPEQGFGSLGFLWPWMRRGVLGFLRQARGFSDDKKISVANRFANLAVHGSFEFSLGYLKGLVHGLWDGLTGPFVLIGDIFKLIGSAISALSHLEKYRPLLKQLETVKQTIQANVKAAIKDFMNGKTDPMKMIGFIGSVLEKTKNAAEKVGQQMANALLKFLEQPDGELGHSIGQLTGNILFEVLLAVLSSGGYTAVKAAIKPLTVVGTKATVILRKLVEHLPALKQGIQAMAQFAATNPAMKKILSSLEEFISKVFDLTKTLYGIGESKPPKPTQTTKSRPQVSNTGNKQKTNNGNPGRQNPRSRSQTNTSRTQPSNRGNNPKTNKGNTTTQNRQSRSQNNKPQNLRNIERNTKRVNSPQNNQQSRKIKHKDSPFTPAQLKALQQLHPNARAYFEEMVKEFGEPAKAFLRKYAQGKFTLNLAQASQEFGIPQQYIKRVQELLKDPRAENLAISLRSSNKAYLDEGYQLATRAKEDLPVLIPDGVKLPDGRVSDGNLTLGASSLGEVKFKTNEMGLVATKLHNAEGKLIEYVVVERQSPKLLVIMPREQVIDSSGKFLLNPKEHLPMGSDVDMHAVIGKFRNENGEMQDLTGKWKWETEFPENLKQELQERVGVKRPDGSLRTGIVHGPLETYATKDLEPLIKEYGSVKNAVKKLEKGTQKQQAKARDIKNKLILMFKEPVLMLVKDQVIQLEGEDIIMMYRLLGRKVPGVDLELYQEVQKWIKAST